MKLGKEPRRERNTRARDMLAQRPEEPIDTVVTDILRLRGQELQFSRNRDIGELREKVSTLVLLEQAAGAPLIPDEQRQEMLDLIAAQPPLLNERAKTEIGTGHFHALEFGAWVQLFPNERDLVWLDDTELDNAVRILQQKEVTMVSREELLVNLMQLRPDKQDELRDVLNPNMDEYWSTRDKWLSDVDLIGSFLQLVAAWEVIYPGAKEKYVLTSEEKRKIIALMRSKVVSIGFARFLLNACIVLAEEVELQPNGQIRIQMKKRQLPGRGPELPQRSVV